MTTTFSRAHPTLPNKRIAMSEADVDECPFCRDVERDRRRTVRKTLLNAAAQQQGGEEQEEVWAHEMLCEDCERTYTIEVRGRGKDPERGGGISTTPQSHPAPPPHAATSAPDVAAPQVTSSDAAADHTTSTAVESEPPGTRNAAADVPSTPEARTDGAHADTAAAPSPAPGAVKPHHLHQQQQRDPATAGSSPPGATLIRHDGWNGEDGGRHSTHPRAAITLAYDVRDRPSHYECPGCGTVVDNANTETGPVRSLDGAYRWKERWSKVFANLMECTECATRFVIRHTAPDPTREVCHSMSSDNKGCPCCSAKDDFFIYDGDNVMFGRIEIRVCFTCRNSWRQKLSSGP